MVDILLSEKLEQSDPRLRSEEFIHTKRTEINGLKRRDTWDATPIQDAPPGSYVIGGRFACEIKNANTNSPQPKARFVCQGYEDAIKDFMVHNSPSLRHTSVKIIVSIAAVRSFLLACLDFNQAYLQSEDTMSRSICFKPRKEDLSILEVGSNMVLKLKKPLYGICDSGDYWAATLS